MKRRLVSGFLLAACVAAQPAGAEIFLRGNAGLLDVEGGVKRGVGDLYQGGGGGSLELGLGLSGWIAVSGEFAPGYNQPRRALQRTQDIDGGSYSALLGNVMFRLEPIESVRPYFFAGGGQGVFHFDYADTGKVFVSAGRVRKIPDDSLKAWAFVVGFGFDAPVSSHIDWGFRVRYLRHRWQSVSEQGILFAFPTGDAYSVEINLKLKT